MSRAAPGSAEDMRGASALIVLHDLDAPHRDLMERLEFGEGISLTVSSTGVAAQVAGGSPIPVIVIGKGEQADGAVGWARSAASDLGLDPGRMARIALWSANPSQQASLLEAGLDDCIDPGMEPRLIRARIGAVLRRMSDGQVVRIDRFELHMLGRIAYFGGARMQLSEQEFAFLSLLLHHAGSPVPRQQLWNEVWSTYAKLEPQDSRIESAAYRVRRALRDMGAHDWSLSAVYGVGYALRKRSAKPVRPARDRGAVIQPSKSSSGFRSA